MTSLDGGCVGGCGEGGWTERQKSRIFVLLPKMGSGVFYSVLADTLEYCRLGNQSTPCVSLNEELPSLLILVVVAPGGRPSSSSSSSPSSYSFSSLFSCLSRAARRTVRHIAKMITRRRRIHTERNSSTAGQNAELAEYYSCYFTYSYDCHVLPPTALGPSSGYTRLASATMRATGAQRRERGQAKSRRQTRGGRS